MSARYTDWQRARGHMSGAVTLRTLEQARADLEIAVSPRRTLIMTAKPNLSSTKLSPCVCGHLPGGTYRDDPGYVISCGDCGYRVIGPNMTKTRVLWNAAMLGLSMEEKEK